jgi:NADH:ubiquinone oxidoreductase subunit K
MSVPPIGLTHYLVFGAMLFCMGLFAVMTRRHVVAVLLGIELMLNAANINLVAFTRYLGGGMGAAAVPNTVLGGQVFALIIMTLAACEVAIGLAIVVCLYRNRGIVNPDDASDMKW